MVNTLPAILIGGPPHAGKSVLFYSLTHALRERGVRHHAIRACPDGEGNWTQESDAETVSQIRIKGEWSNDFVQRICQDLEHRCLPLLVDMGGRPKDSQMCILRQCSHALLLLRADREEYTQLWQRLVTESDLLPLAQIFSQREGTSTITSQSPVLEGILTGLERHNTPILKGPLFESLVEQIAALFNSYSPQDLEKVLLEQAPTELVINIYESLQMLAPSSTRWEPWMLEPLLSGLPEHTPMSVYGAGPHWLYAALVAYTGDQPFYQFDPRLGWIRPIPLSINTARFPELKVQTSHYQEVTKLAIEIVPKHLDYFQPEPLPFPPVPQDTGLLITGSIPSWLLTSLVRLYKGFGIPWIATHYPPINKAIVVYSQGAFSKPGDSIDIPG